jgi:carboxymethylenebutenolidase
MMNDMQDYLVSEFAEEYQEGRLSRRDALKLIASVTGSLVFANSVLAACTPAPEPVATQHTTVVPEATATSTPTSPESVMQGDPAVAAGPVEIAAADATLFGYLAHPAAEGSFPVVLVCHENSGLTPHIQDVTRRFAKAGYVSLAMDLASREGGFEALGSEGVSGALGSAPTEQLVGDFVTGWNYLKDQPFAESARVGMTGFCFGGGVTWRVAAGMPELLAAVPFYGPAPLERDVPKIQAAVLAIYGEQDSRINASIPTIEAAMLENGKIYEKVIYPGANHGFFNDTRGGYHAQASQDAWARTLAWFEKYL